VPGTPGAGGALDIAATPGAPGPPGAELCIHWEGVLVSLPGDGSRVGVVASVMADGRGVRVRPGALSPGSGAWEPEAGADELVLDGHQLELVQPVKKDRVKILSESDTAAGAPGTAGTLIGVDVTDGIVKVDNTTDLAIIDMRLLGKLVA